MSSISWTFLFISGFFWSNGNPKHIPSFAGPYRVIGKRVWNESEEFHSTGEHFMVRARFTSPRPHDKQYIWGAVYMGHSLNDDMKAEARMSVWANNQWKRNAFVFKFDHACTALFTHAKSLPALVLEPHEMKCPVKPVGHRVVKNQTFEPVFPYFPVIPYGRYRFDLGFEMPDNTYLVIVGDIEIVPKL